ncbi:hypothetical protein Q2298_03690 [Rhodococcus electrodiphilus]|uniref:hypothetical protein n=1 Tax=Rhodococcus ruber TaxID=1830 RepID=UPI0026F471E6|nr:hypothetical protein [Rhodococcus ruber]MDO2377448.1 hypothetical protein [Rhodococcus ruber]
MNNNVRRDVVDLFKVELGRQSHLVTSDAPTFESILANRDAVRQAAAEVLGRFDALDVVTELAEFSAWVLMWALDEFEQEPMSPVLRLSRDYVFGDEED